MNKLSSRIPLPNLSPLSMLILNPSDCLIVGTNDKILLRIDSPYTQISQSKETDLSQIECLAEGGSGRFWASGSSNLLDDIRIFLFSKDLNVLKSFKGHSDTVISLAFHDGSLYSSSEDSTVKAWSQSSTVGETLYTHSTPIISFAFDTFSQHLASSDTDNNLKVFSLMENREVWNKTLEDKIWSMKFVPGKYLIVFGDHVGNLTGLNFRNKREEFRINAHESRIKTIWVAGDFIITGSFDQKVCVRNLNDIDNVNVIQEHSDWVRCVCANDRFAFSGSDDKTICVNTFLMVENKQRGCWDVTVIKIKENPKIAGGLGFLGMVIVVLVIYLIISSS